MSKNKAGGGTKVYRKLKKLLLVSMVIWMTILTLLPTHQVNATGKTETIKVGFPIQTGLTEIDDDGSYTGYTVSYLEELSKYTDWKYEFVQVDGDIDTQLTTLLGMLQNGEIDMMGAMNYNESLKKMFLYPNYSYGTSYVTLACASSSTKWMTEDYENWDGMKIAWYHGFESRSSVLEQFAQVNGFQYELVEYKTLEECIQAVKSHKADATIQVDISMESGLRGLTRFSRNPFYLCLSPKRTDLLKKLNNGMNALNLAYPNFQNELHNQYFNWEGNFRISDEGKKYIESLGTLKVLFVEGNTPIQNKGKDGPTGVAASYFEKLAEDTGLKYKVVYADDYESCVEMINSGKVDLVAAIPRNANIIEDVDLKIGLPYYTSYGSLVSSSPIVDIDLKDVKTLTPNTEKIMYELQKDSSQAYLLDGQVVNYYLQKSSVFSRLNVEWSNNSTMAYAVGFTSHIEDRLMAILNSHALQLDEKSKQMMLNQNLRQKLDYSLSDYVKTYALPILIVFVTIIATIVSIVFYMKNKMLRIVEKQKQRAYDFFSMTDECLVEYDYKTDDFSIQNQHYLFLGRKNIYHFLHLDPDMEFMNQNEREAYAVLYEMFNNREDVRDICIPVSGEYLWFRIELRYQSDHDFDHVIGRVVNINDEMVVKQNLMQQAHTDSLTGLLNRFSFTQKITEFLKQDDAQGVFILIDIDNFKKVNDLYGHMKGDEILIDFAKCLNHFFRASDWKVRLGGDEFVVFLPNSIENDVLETKINHLYTKTRELFKDYNDIGLSISIGICYAYPYSTYEELYQTADEAMYESKRSGKGRFKIHK